MGIHIGQLIKEEVARQGLTIDQFASLINTSRSNVYGIFDRLTVNLELLTRISKVLHRNFLEEMAQQMQLELGESPEESAMVSYKLKSMIRSLGIDDDGEEYFEPAFVKNREELKTLLKEYFTSDHRIPLLILEAGYTFGAREVVKQMATELFPGAASSPCPKLLDVPRVKSMPAKVLIDYIDCNTFDSIEASDARLNDIFRVQGDMNKKFVCIIHTDTIASLSEKGGTKAFDHWGGDLSIALSRKSQFFITVYHWDRSSLLSWATDAGLHEYVLNYISKHQVPEGVRKDYQLTQAHISFFGLTMGHSLLRPSIDYPTAEAYRQSDWEYVSDFIANQRDINQEQHLRGFIQDIIDFNEMNKA